MIDKIIKAGYKTLQLINFFTAGPDEVRSWTIRDGSKAPRAGATIHSDFENFFVCAEIMKFTDLAELGTEADVKAEGKYLQKGKEYMVLDGDVIYFKIGTTQKVKK